MRTSFLFAVGAALGLGAHTALGNVICDGERHSGIHLSEKATEFCFEHICATHGPGNEILQHCGPIVLTLTQFRAAFPNSPNCTSAFRGIIDKCFTTEGVQGGVLEIPEALYSIFATSEDIEKDGELDNVRDGKPSSGDKIAYFKNRHGSTARSEVRPYEVGNSEASALRWRDNDNGDVPDIYDIPHNDYSNIQVPRARGGKARAGKTKGRSRLKSSPKTRHRSRPKANHKTKSKTTKPKTTKPKPKSCPAVKPAGRTGPTSKSKNTVRDVLGSIFPRLLYSKLFPRAGSPASSALPASHDTPSPRRKGDKQADAQCEPSVRPWYRAEHLHRDLFMHWTFERKTGWSNGLKRLEQYQKIRKIPARDILEKMLDGGTLDVVRVKNAHIAVKGKQNGGSLPNEYAHEHGNYVLCNGGFFYRATEGSTNPYDRWSIGKTSSTTNHYRIPSNYNKYYDYLNKDVDPNNYLASGPRLDRPLDFSLDIFKYFKDPATEKELSIYATKPGSLAHASQPNERLVIVELENGNKYIFAYTAISRGHGVDLNKMREIAQEFLRVFHNVRDAKKILNLDGGGSLYLGWKPANGNVRDIALGKDAQAEGGTENPRRITNFVKLTTGP